MDKLINLHAVEKKLDYLRELRGIEPRTAVEINQKSERINRVCDSIEVDLGVRTIIVAKASHQCIGCGTQGHNLLPYITDGIRCVGCGDSMVPISSLPTKSPPGSN